MVASVPIAMQVVCTSMMALESRALAENKPLCHGWQPSKYSLRCTYCVLVKQAKSLFTVLCLASASDVVVVSGATDRTGLMFDKFLKELKVNVRGFIRNVTKARERLR